MTGGVQRRLRELWKTSPPPEVEGFRSDMDAPRDGGEHPRGPVLAGGWIADRLGAVSAVDVHVNGVRVQRVTDFHERPDVVEGVPSDLHVVGWTTLVDLSALDGDECELSVWSIRRDGTRVACGHARLDIVTGSKQLHGGTFLVPPLLLPGHQRIYGSVRCPGGAARVDVTVDGVPAGRARVALPGHFDDPAAPEDFIGAFEYVLALQGAAGTSVVLGARVTSMDGSEFDLPAVTVEIGFHESELPSTSRLVALRARAAVRSDSLRRAGDLAGSEPIRALVFTHDLELGGAQLYLQELLLRLANEGIWCAVVSPRDGVLRAELEALGFPVHVTGAMPLDDVDAYEGRMAEFLSWAAPLDPTAAIANTMLAFPGVDAAQRLGVPVIWAIHESFELDQFWMEAFPPGYLHPYVQDRARSALRGATHVVFEADATRQQYEEHLTAGASTVVPYGVDVAGIDEYIGANDRESVRASLDIRPSCRVLLCMGTIEPRKAQIMLASAFHGVDADDAMLVLVGARPGEYLNALERFVDAHDERRIRIQPIVADTYKWYRAADMLVCASDVESLPRSILEAMAFGIPALSTAVFGVPELITDEQTGFLCEARDMTALRRRIEDVLALPPSEWERVGAAGSELVRRKHDPAIYAGEYARLLAAGRG